MIDNDLIHILSQISPHQWRISTVSLLKIPQEVSLYVVFLCILTWCMQVGLRIFTCEKNTPTFPPFTSLAFQDLKIPFDSSGLEAIQLYEGPHSSMHQEELWQRWHGCTTVGGQFGTRAVQVTSALPQRCLNTAIYSRWRFQRFFIFAPTWGNNPIWLIFFRWAEATN